MAREQNEQREIVVNFDYYGDSLVLGDDEDDGQLPGAYAGEARVEVDPLVEAFARSPYDPVIGLMMMGRATGEVIARPPKGGWMRMLSWLLAIGLIAQFLLWLIFTPQSVDGVKIIGYAIAAPSFVASLCFAAAGVLLIRRLVAGSGRR